MHKKIKILGISDDSKGSKVLSYLDSQLSQLEASADVKIVQTNSNDALQNLKNEDIDIVLFVAPIAVSQGYTKLCINFLETVSQSKSHNPHIIFCNDSPGRLFFLGNILFCSNTLTTRKLVHDLVVPAPTNSRPEKAFENRVLDAIRYPIKNSGEKYTKPPTLGSENWALTIGDNSSRDIWFTWVPRFANFLYENPLIQGATGTGKTNLAKALHHQSGRSGPFVSITPRDFSSSELMQAELFGSTSGAFTGAIDRWGLVKQAEKGTLFLDELQSIDLDLQGKLITFIESKCYRRVGSPDTHDADVRFIFATNRSIDDLVKEEIIRDDFAYRLEGLKLDLPDLKDRPLDIPPAVAHAMAKAYAERYAHLGEQNFPVGFTELAFERLFSYDWPGNLRQLQYKVATIIDRAIFQGEHIISDNTVANVLNIKKSSNSFSQEELISNASNQLIKLLDSTGTPKNLSSILSQVSNRIRLLSIKMFDGDTKKAAAFTGEDPKVLQIAKTNKEILKDV